MHRQLKIEDWSEMLLDKIKEIQSIDVKNADRLVCFSELLTVGEELQHLSKVGYDWISNTETVKETKLEVLKEYVTRSQRAYVIMAELFYNALVEYINKPNRPYIDDDDAGQYLI